MKSVVFISVLLVPLIQSFLLDQSHKLSNQNTTNNYLTVSEYFDEKKIQEEVHRQDVDTLRKENSKLRHDMDKTIELLTNQIQQKLGAIENKISQNGNDQKYSQLLQKYSTLEQKYSSLEQHYKDLEIKLKSKEGHNETSAQYASLEQKYNDLNSKYNAIQGKYSVIENELKMVKNETVVTKSNINALQTLSNIQPLSELNTLKQTVQTLTVKTNSLDMNDVARQQDFLALYKELNSFISRTNNAITNVNETQFIQISDLQNRTSDQLSYFETAMNNKLLKKEAAQNSTIDGLIHALNDANLTDALLDQKINDISEKVFLTAFRKTSIDLKSGQIIKLDDVKYHAGINNIQTFINTGKFTCEKEGLYLVSISLHSPTNGADYDIYLNGNRISYQYIGRTQSAWEKTDTIALPLELRVNDNVWIQSNAAFLLYGGLSSKFSIVKLK